MMNKRRWLIPITAILTSALILLLIIVDEAVDRFEPYIREQAITYLQKRFDSEVELAALRIGMPDVSPMRLLLTRGQSLARVEGEGVVLRHRGRRDVPPMFVIKKFSFEVNLGSVFDSPKRIHTVTIDGMEINIPPKGERPDLQGEEDSRTDIVVEQVLVNDSVLRIIPKDREKTPLQFDLHRLLLESAGNNVAMQYDALLTNAKPPGEIQSKGSLGPWSADEPGDTPLAGNYAFNEADLGVFAGIAGILASTGQFAGTLDSITARGEATVPDFRLKSAGNAVPLKTRFEVLVDGTNGNTILQPVIGTIGTTNFTTSGGVIRHEAERRRAVSLDVNMPKGSLRDILTLAMKGSPFMEGEVFLKTKIEIPPLSGKVKEKLLLDGQFEITRGKFLRYTIQDHIDTLSRRGQGQPSNTEIDEVVLGMGGEFTLEDQLVDFRSLSFAVPGAGVDLAGSYDLGQDTLDFHGTLKLDAKISQTMTGWKRWLLKPIDPFFAKQGAGTLLQIQVVGTAKEPKFGRDKGPQNGDN
jgi:hypothetical protein